MTDNLSTQTLADGAHVTSPDGGVTVVKPALTLEEMNATLGSTFTDIESAKKGLKDTFTYVGKRKEDIIQEIKASSTPVATPDVASKGDIQALRNELFYSQNPQFKPYQGMLSQLGADPAEVVNRPDVKGVIEKAQAADVVANNKSVVSSNSRLSQSKSVIDSAVQIANARGSTMEDVSLTFARAINESNNQG